jgi:PII-like signaling protein
MKRIFVFTIIAIPIFIIIGCKNKDERITDMHDDIKNLSSSHQITLYDMKGLSQTFWKELKIFIHEQDSLVGENYSEYNIVVVFFSETEGACFVTIATEIYYDSNHLQGYQEIDDKLIAFYNPDNVCNKGIVDSSKLRTGVPQDFPNENSPFAIHTTYDPSGKRFKIHSKDNLELVFSGPM